MKYDVIVVGGGAAGFFTAINAAENNKDLKILILERGKEVLSKVRISGGGRCNVTHAEFIPNELTKNYPRGEKELLGPFHTFMTGDMMGWLEERNVPLKIEEDGRVFPVSNTSASIINCFVSEARRLDIEIKTGYSLQKLAKNEGQWIVHTNREVFETEKLMMATGSNPKIWDILENLGHTITPAVPSLFTFIINDKRIKDLAGVSTEVSINVQETRLVSEGPLLITHKGMSGPAILKLSAWGALTLHAKKYQFIIHINWLHPITKEETLNQLMQIKREAAKKIIFKTAQFELPKRLWQSLVVASGIKEEERWADISNKKIQSLAMELTSGAFSVEGKNTFKEEFVTAGGVDLKEINFKTFESKLHQNLYLAGEVLNIDAITGGFNFQNAWSGGFLAAKAMSVT